MSLYIFDKDGTLIRLGRIGTGFRRAPLTCEEQVLLPGVFEKFAQLRAAGHSLAIASNQSAVAYGLINLSQAAALMENCAAKLGGVMAWRLCPYDPHAEKYLHRRPNPYACDDVTRKPHPGMILDLMSELGYSSKNSFMIGNSKTDEKAARAARVRFLPADKFFKF